jgi:hypothetical protein
LERLGRKFNTVIDCGLFHSFDAAERRAYAASLASVTEREGTLFVLCFGDVGADVGPHPVSEDDLRAAFDESAAWRIVAIAPDRVQTRFHGENGAPAWLGTINRI